jgi:hypothetical protein
MMLVTEAGGSEAGERARAAGRRAEELEDRLQRLRAGEPVTDADSQRAAEAAEQQLGRSALAHRRAGAANRRAAQTHRDAADLAEVGGHPDEASRLRGAARLDDDAAESDLRAALHDEKD